MDITPLVKSNAQIIQSYKNGVFKISGEVYQGAVLVRPDAVTVWDAPDFEQLSVADFSGIGAEVLLLGTGEKMRFLSPALRHALREAGVTVEVMDTAAACRTYNVLLAEGRQVCAALIPVSV
jgi:uncharacterized protein